MIDYLIQLSEEAYCEVFNKKAHFRVYKGMLSTIESGKTLSRIISLEGGTLDYPNPTYGIYTHEEMVFFDIIRDRFNRRIKA